MLSFIISCKSDEEKKQLGQTIHEALKGSKIYVDSDVLLNIDSPNMIYLAIGDRNDNNRVIYVQSDDVRIAEVIANELED